MNYDTYNSANYLAQRAFEAMNSGKGIRLTPEEVRMLSQVATFAAEQTSPNRA